MSKKNIAPVSMTLPSLRGGKSFNIIPLRYRGVKLLMKAKEIGGAEIMDVIIGETLRQAFPDITIDEIDNLEQEDVLTLMPVAIEANEGLSEADFR